MRSKVLSFWVLAMTSLCVGMQDDILAEPGKGKGTIFDYLDKIGGELEFHVTIERANYNRERPSSYYSEFALPEKPAKTIAELVTSLKDNLAGFTIIENKNNPRIIHIIDKQLAEHKGYLIDQRTDVSYRGVLAELAGDIGTRIKGVGQRTIGLTSDGFDDWVTTVEVEQKDKPVRDILTDAVPLEKYSRLLWTSESRFEKGEWRSMIQYFGPKRPRQK